MNGRAELSGDSIVLPRFTMKSANGSADGEGTVRLAGLTNPILNLRLRAKDFRAIDQRDFLSLTASAALAAAGTARQRRCSPAARWPTRACCTSPT